MKDGCLLWEIQEASGPYLGKDAPLASTTALLVSTGIASDNLRHLVAGKHAYCVCCYAMSQRTYNHHVWFWLPFKVKLTAEAMNRV